MKANAHAPAAAGHSVDEEVAYKLVQLYFGEVARQGFKRSLDLDSIINAYLYALGRLRNKDKELGEIMHLVTAEEKKLGHETRSQVLPEAVHGHDATGKPVIH